MRIARLAGVTVLIASIHCSAAKTSEIKVLTTNGLKGVLNRAGPGFERETGHKLNIQYGAGPLLKKRIEAGDAFDVAILPLDISDLVKQGKIVADTVIGRTGYGAAIRKGAPKPDIGTADFLRRTLLKARSVVYTAEGISGTYVRGVVRQLGITDEMKSTLRPIKTEGASGPVATVAAGEADIAIAGIAVILGGTGVELAGWLPHELQSYLVFSAGVSGSAGDATAARAFVKALTSPAAVEAFKSAGIEAITSQSR